MRRALISAEERSASGGSSGSWWQSRTRALLHANSSWMKADRPVSAAQRAVCGWRLRTLTQSLASPASVHKPARGGSDWVARQHAGRLTCDVVRRPRALMAVCLSGRGDWLRSGSIRRPARVDGIYLQPQWATSHVTLPRTQHELAEQPLRADERKPG